MIQLGTVVALKGSDEQTMTVYAKDGRDLKVVWWCAIDKRLKTAAIHENGVSVQARVAARVSWSDSLCQLASGSPQLALAGFDDDRAEVYYWREGNLEKQSLPLAALAVWPAPSKTS